MAFAAVRDDDDADDDDDEEDDVDEDVAAAVNVAGLPPGVVASAHEGRSGDMSGVSSGASSPTLVLKNMQLMTPRASPLPPNYAAAAVAAAAAAAGGNQAAAASALLMSAGGGGVSPSVSGARIAFNFEDPALIERVDEELETSSELADRYEGG